MDVMAYDGVIRRQWIVVLVGLVIAQSLALMAVVRVTADGLRIAPRLSTQPARPSSSQEGFPWGRSG